jgi:hypothetical protein
MVKTSNQKLNHPFKMLPCEDFKYRKAEIFADTGQKAFLIWLIKTPKGPEGLEKENIIFAKIIFAVYHGNK